MSTDASHSMAVASDPDSGRPARSRGSASAGSRLWRIALAQIKDGRILSIVVLAVGWQVIITALHVNHLVLPTTGRVLADWYHIIANGTLLHAGVSTLELAAVGFGLAVGIGIPIGLTMGMVRWFRGLANPYIALVLATPFVAFLPVLILWFGTADVLVVAAAIVFSLPYLVLNVDAGVRGVAKNLQDMARVFQAPALTTIVRVILRGALESVVLGLKEGASQAVKGVVIAQILSSISGIGGLIGSYGSAFRTGHLLATVLTVLIFILVVNALFDLLRVPLRGRGHGT